MEGNNIKLLTQKELSNLKDLYYFKLDEAGQNVLVGNNYFKRITPHPVDEGFGLNSKVRVIKISKEAIQIWIDLNEEYNLFDIQQAINILKIMFQEIDAASIKELLDKNILDRLED